MKNQQTKEQKYIQLALVFSLDSFNVDLQVKFTHALDDGFFAFLIDFHSESGIFTLETAQSLQIMKSTKTYLGKVGIIVLVLGADSEGNDRLRDVHGSHRVVDLVVGEGIT